MRKKVTDNFTELEEDDELWMTSDGDIIPIAGMKCTHIFYAVKLLLRESPLYKKVFNEEIKIPKLMLERYEKCKEEIPEYYL